MLNLLAIDPGIRATGAAFARDGEIIAAAHVQNTRPRGGSLREVYTMGMAVATWGLLNTPGGRPIHAVCERPLKVWASTFQHLQPLLAIGGVVCGALAAWRVLDEHAEMPWEYFPADWKGTGSADACTMRVRRRLSDLEFAMIELPPKTCAECMQKNGQECTRPDWCLAHNVYDAVGIALTALGRFEKIHKVRR